MSPHTLFTSLYLTSMAIMAFFVFFELSDQCTVPYKSCMSKHKYTMMTDRYNTVWFCTQNFCLKCLVRYFSVERPRLNRFANSNVVDFVTSILVCKFTLWWSSWLLLLCPANILFVIPNFSQNVYIICVGSVRIMNFLHLWLLSGFFLWLQYYRLDKLTELSCEITVFPHFLHIILLVRAFSL